MEPYHKICPNCKVDKLGSEYNKHAKANDGLQGWCRDCGKARGLEYYYAHKDHLYAASKIWQLDLKDKILAEKDKPCADCGNRFDPVCMDFDHLPQYPKYMDISKMYAARKTWESIKAEIEKCEVVCSNCHRLRTKKRSEGLRKTRLEWAQML